MSSHLKTTVYLDRESYTRLKSIARARRCPPAQLVREAVAQYAAREMPERKPRSIGAGNSGRRNLSERDEDLLARMPRR
jgi:ribbon-helix-helix protein